MSTPSTPSTPPVLIPRPAAQHPVRVTGVWVALSPRHYRSTGKRGLQRPAVLSAQRLGRIEALIAWHLALRAALTHASYWPRSRDMYADSLSTVPRSNADA